MDMTPVLLHITAASREEAMTLCRELLSERLIACANSIEHATSMYWWQGQIEHTAEVVIMAKTVAGRVDAVTARVKSLHSYSCPCVVSMKIEGGNADYIAWIGQETRHETP